MFLEKINNEEEWKKSKYLEISNYPWDVENYKPNAMVKFAYTDEGIKIGFKVKEKKLNIEYINFNEPVYKDSCVEAFINFDPKNSDEYINFEMNAIGTLLAQVGPNGAQRRFLEEEDFNNIKIKTDVTIDNY
ncbi:MAG: carbohydrate-binding family 9-like protein, partial [Sarcina sp.]